MNKYMKLAYDKAMENSQNNVGGPFGCCIVKDGEVVCVTSNSVLNDNDPTAHGEMNAIREAGKILGTYDLSGCELYTTAAPCPMCLSAIIWANITKVYFGCNCEDAEGIGFRDNEMYKLFAGEETEGIELEMEQIDRTECLEIFKKYAETNKIIY